MSISAPVSRSTRWGTPIATPWPSLTHLFPGPEVLARTTEPQQYGTGQLFVQNGELHIRSDFLIAQNTRQILKYYIRFQN